MRLDIPGKPIKKKRPRSVLRGGRVIVYDSQKDELKEWQKVVKPQIPHIIECPVEISIEFVMPTTKAWSKRKLHELEHGKTFWHVKRPDIDNLEKWVLDGLNGLAYKDDSQVVKVQTIKRYGLNPRTVVVLLSLQDGYYPF